MTEQAKITCDFLDKFNISYKLYEHQPVYTVDDVQQANLNIPGVGTKNLFLKDKTHKNFLLFISEESRKVDLKAVAEQVNSKCVSFASAQELNQFLNLELGNVGPLGLIYDTEHRVKVLLSKELQGKADINVSANSLTTTLTIDFEDLCKFIEVNTNEFIIID